MGLLNNEHAACGISMQVNIGQGDLNEEKVMPEGNHELLQNALTTLKCQRHRTGETPEGVSDGSGLRIFGFPVNFFNKKIQEKKFVSAKDGKSPLKANLENGKFGIGQFFLETSHLNSNTPEASRQKDVAKAESKHLIEAAAAKNGLRVIGWRELKQGDGLDLESGWGGKAIPNGAKKILPTIMQAIIVSAYDDHIEQEELDRRLVKMNQTIVNACLAIKRDKRNPIATPVSDSSKTTSNDLVTVVSLSSSSINYKGLTPTPYLARFFTDLGDKLFTAIATIGHGRMATNTAPQWRNGQPTGIFIAHNGELNTAYSNATEMRLRGKHHHALGDNKLSDSIQFDRDLLNQISDGLSLEEAVTLLMPPTVSNFEENDPIRHMIEYNSLYRTPYNGPAFMIAGDATKNTFIAKLDAVGLRPARYSIIKEANGSLRFYASSEHDYVLKDGEKFVKLGIVSPGGMIMIKNGKFYDERKTLEEVHRQSSERLAKQKGKSTFVFKENLDEITSTLNSKKERSPEDTQIDEKLYEKACLSMWDEEMQRALDALVLTGKEQTQAMGADTPQLDRGDIRLHFHLKFAQVSSPAIDAIKERDSFTLRTALGPNLKAKNITSKRSLIIDSPILKEDELFKIVNNDAKVAVCELDMLYDSSDEDLQRNKISMEAALEQLCENAEKFAREVGGVIVLSDKNVSKGNLSIPDIIAARAIRNHLAKKGLINNVSIVVDSMQISNTHNASLLLSMGASAVYSRAMYQQVRDFSQSVKKYGALNDDGTFEEKKVQKNLDNLQKSMEFGLLQNMGGLGYTDVNNFIGGCTFEILGMNMEEDLDVTKPFSLASLFADFPSKLSGHKTEHFLKAYKQREAKAVNNRNLPRLGHFRPEAGGEKHGFNQGMVTAMQKWLRAEHLKDTLNGFNQGADELTKQEFGLRHEDGYIAESEVKESYKNGKFSSFRTSDSFKEFWQTVEQDRAENPTSLYDDFKVKGSAGVRSNEDLNKDIETFQKIAAGYKRNGESNLSLLAAPLSYMEKELVEEIEAYIKSTKKSSSSKKTLTPPEKTYIARLVKTKYHNRKLVNINTAIEESGLQDQDSIMRTLVQGNMSQGALTTGDLFTPGSKKAWETIVEGMNAAGGLSAAGEGGEDSQDVKDPFKSAAIKQIASGRFGISANQIASIADGGWIEIKITQGAKPGQGGKLPDYKVTIRIGMQRGSLPTELSSPAPHHDLYSIEDIKQLISNVKSVNPRIGVGVKLTSSTGIGAIANGVAKAGADIINIASGSGGTGAAMQTSVQSAGMPSEIGLREADESLREAGLRDKVKLETSSGFKTPDDVIKAAIMGADLFEFGTVAMMTVGCVMQRTCYISCEPGVATDAKNFKGKSVDTARFFRNIAAGVQEILFEIQKENPEVKTLKDLQGRFDLMEAINQEKYEYFGLDQLVPKERARWSKKEASQEDQAARGEEVQKLKTVEEIAQERQKSEEHSRMVEDGYIADIADRYETEFNDNDFHLALRRDDRDYIPLGEDERIDVSNLGSFGSRFAGRLNRYMENTATKKNPILLKVYTEGNAGQSYGFVNNKGILLNHKGFAQDGVGESMSGGILAILRPEDQLDESLRDETIPLAGNSLFYGASGGEGYIAGSVGERFGVLLKGASVVCEGAEDYACEYMTDGTALILGKTGRHLGAGASGGIIFTYDESSDRDVANDVAKLKEPEKEKGESDDKFQERLGQFKEYQDQYYQVIISMIEKHYENTGSRKAEKILEAINNPKTRDAELAKFSVYLPEKFKQVNTLGKLRDACDIYLLRGNDKFSDREISPALAIRLNYHFIEMAQKMKSEADKIVRELDDLRTKKNQKPVLVAEKISMLNRFKASLDDFNAYIRERNYPFITDESRKAMIAAAGYVEEIANSRPLDMEIKKQKEESMKNRTWAEKMTPKNIAKSDDWVNRVGESANVAEAAIDHLDINYLDVVSYIKTYAKMIEKDAGNCTGCAAPCSGVGSDTGCPANKPINAINAKMKYLAGSIDNVADGEKYEGGLTYDQWKILHEAFMLQSEKTPFFAFTGAACPAFCQTACSNVINGRDPVQIRNIEWHLYQIGRAMGWFEATPKTEFSKEEQDNLFVNRNDNRKYAKYIEEQSKDALFAEPKVIHEGKKVIVVGSGPAGMQIAWEALREGYEVEMYEKSNLPGGLLMNGIPAHKFEKTHVMYAFEQMKKMAGNRFKLFVDTEVKMGLASDQQERQGLHTSSRKEALFDSEGNLMLDNGKVQTNETENEEINIYNPENAENVKVAVCIGAGKPRDLDPEDIQGLESMDGDYKDQHIFQALTFLQKANALAFYMQYDDQAKEQRDRYENALNNFRSKTEGLDPDSPNDSLKYKSYYDSFKLALDEYNKFAYEKMQEYYGDMCPIVPDEDEKGKYRAKTILVLGGGFTAQDVMRITARAIGATIDGDITEREPTESEKRLKNLSRGPENAVQADGYNTVFPLFPEDLTPENQKRNIEMESVGAGIDYQAQIFEVHRVDKDDIGKNIGGKIITQKDVNSGKLVVLVQHYEFDLSSLEDENGNIPDEKMMEFRSMSRADKEAYFPIKPKENIDSVSGGRIQDLVGVSVHVVDSIALALGTEGYEKNEFAMNLKTWAYVAGDAHGNQGESIIGAQASAMQASDEMFEREQRISNGVYAKKHIDNGGCKSCGSCAAAGMCNAQITGSNTIIENANDNRNETMLEHIGHDH